MLPHTRTGDITKSNMPRKQRVETQERWQDFEHKSASRVGADSLNLTTATLAMSDKGQDAFTAIPTAQRQTVERIPAVLWRGRRMEAMISVEIGCPLELANVSWSGTTPATEEIRGTNKCECRTIEKRERWRTPATC